MDEVKVELDGVVSGYDAGFGAHKVLLFALHQEFDVAFAMGDPWEPLELAKQARDLVGRRVRVTVEVVDG